MADLETEDDDGAILIDVSESNWEYEVTYREIKHTFSIKKQ